MKIKTFTAFSALAMLTAGTALADGTPLWTAEGFKNPESIVAASKRDVYFVSNVNGPPLEKDGNGFISRLTPEGEIETLEWVTGLNGPKGMILDGDKLYVTDIDHLVEIDAESGEIVGQYPAEGAIFLNDPAVGPDGTVYVSDIAGRKIFARAPGADALDVWFAPEDMMHINGLRVEDGKLIVAGWGREMNDDGSTKIPGNLLIIDLETKEMANLGSGQGIGNLDGLERAGDDFLVTDFIAGALYRIRADGTHDVLLDLDAGSADLTVSDDGKTVIIPMLMDGKVTAYTVE